MRLQGSTYFTKVKTLTTTSKKPINDSLLSILLDEIAEVKARPEGVSIKQHETQKLLTEIRKLMGYPAQGDGIAKLIDAWPELLIPMVVSCLHDETNQTLKRAVLLKILLAPAPVTEERRYQEIMAKFVQVATSVGQLKGLAMIADAVGRFHPDSFEKEKQLDEIARLVRFAILKDLPDFKDEPTPEQAVQTLMAYEEILKPLPAGDSLGLEEALRSRYAIVVRNYESAFFHDLIPAESKARDITTIEQLTSEESDDSAKCFALLCQPQFDEDRASVTNVAKSMFDKHAFSIMHIRDWIRNKKPDEAASLLNALMQSPDLTPQSKTFIGVALAVLDLMRVELKQDQLPLARWHQIALCRQVPGGREPGGWSPSGQEAIWEKWH